jgi:hypothetical protein
MTMWTNVGRRLLLVSSLGALLSTGAAGQRAVSSSPPLWDTRTVSNGVHQLTARAIDVTGAVATHTIVVKVLNGGQ